MRVSSHTLVNVLGSVFSGTLVLPATTFTCTPNRPLKKKIYTRWLEYDLFILGQVQLVFIAVTASVLIRTLQNMKANKVLVTCKLILL